MLMNSPLIDGHAWWAGLCVVGLASLTGAALPPWRGGRIGWAARTAAGLAVVAAVALGAGQVEGFLFHPWMWSALGIAGWAVALFALKKSARNFRGLVVIGPSELIALIGWLVVGVWLLVILGPAVSPPVSYDVLEYHQGIIPSVFERGRFEPIPGVVYTRQPIATEALYTLAAAIEGNAWGRAPGILQWLMIVLGASAFARALRRFGITSMWRPWAVLLLLTQPIIFTLQLDRLTDWTGVMLLAAGLAAVRSRGLGAAGLVGVIAGGAVDAKWTHAGTVALPLAIMAVALAPRGKRIARAVVFACAAALMWLPWGVWTWHVARNPFSPFMARWFPTDFWPPARLEFLMETHGRISPIQLQYWTNLTGRLGWGLEGVPWIALALVAACGGVVWARKLKRAHGSRMNAAGWMAAGLLASALLWGELLHAAARFLAPSILLSIFVIIILAREAGSRVPRRMMALLLAGIVMLSVAFTAGQLQRVRALAELTSLTLAGNLTGDDYSRLNLGSTYELFEAANRLPESSRLIAVNEARRYWFRRPVALASVFDRSPAEPIVRGAADAGTIRARLAAAGYTHILVNEYEQARILAMHTPPALVGNRELASMIARNDQSAMVGRFCGATEFAIEPLKANELAAWKEFLGQMRERAVWRAGNRPAMFIAKL